LCFQEILREGAEPLPYGFLVRDFYCGVWWKYSFFSEYLFQYSSKVFSVDYVILIFSAVATAFAEHFFADAEPICRTTKFICINIQKSVDKLNIMHYNDLVI